MTAAVTARRRRVVAYFQRPEDAGQAVEQVGAQAPSARLHDAGQFEDAHAFGTIGRLLTLGGIAGTVVGIVGGWIVAMASGAPSLPVAAIGGIALGAFGALTGLLTGSAVAEARRSSGQGLAFDAVVDGTLAAGVEDALRSHGATVVEDLPA